METRIAMIGIIVENPEAVASLNAVLHDYGAYVIGRMGIPYHKRGVNLISIAIDAPQDVISACGIVPSGRRVISWAMPWRLKVVPSV